MTKVHPSPVVDGTAQVLAGAERRLAGIGVSAGRVVGPVQRCRPSLHLPSDRVCSDVSTESWRATTALAEVGAALERLAGSADGEGAEILEALGMLVTDEVLAEAVTGRIVRDQLRAEHAVWAAFEEHKGELVRHGGYMADRAADMDDLRDRVVAVLLGTTIEAPQLGDVPSVLVAGNLGPADTVGLDPERVLAIVIEAGGPTCHTAILARALAIPAVVGCAGAAGLADGTTVLVDGATGEVVADPGTDRVAGARRAPVPRGGRAALRRAGAGRTADGVEVLLAANVAGPAEARAAVEAGAAGVGLFRTELAFLGRTERPSVDEQADLYEQVLACFPGRPVVIRTLDAGADKPLPFLRQPAEENPALGVRGWRISRYAPQVVEDQLEAIARATSRSGAQVQVMSPMIATVEEMSAFAEAARRSGLADLGVPVGMMVEVPAAALHAAALFEVADFASIGTNDLAQYAMAADRMSGALAELNDPWQPAVLRLVAMTAASGAAAGRPVGVCGEAAADPLLACVLVGLGIRRLSMGSAALAAVDEQLGRHRSAALEEAAALVLLQPTAAAARAAALGALGGEAA